ncbi:MAG: F0F1 ATP synthase subunit B [Lautropia sp.]|nr:F0F1 ATP synthase subunit B [Lautropia sp.]
MYINATIIVQCLIFAALWWFTARFVWPPITAALDERSKKIAAGLAAADQAKSDLQAAEKRVEQELRQARANAMEVRAGADKQAAELIEQARAEAARIISAAQKSAAEEASLAAERARDQLRDQVAQLAVSGAERILKREIDVKKHADLLSNLKNELR